MSGVGVAKVAQILDLCNFIPQMELKGHRIMIRDVNRPALQLSGYFEHFEQSRVQIIGNSWMRRKKKRSTGSLWLTIFRASFSAVI